MDGLVERLYGLAGGNVVKDDDLVAALRLCRCGDDAVYSDGVADLAATLEDALTMARGAD